MPNFPAYKSYTYDREKMDIARKELNIKSLDEQEIEWEIKPKNKQ